MSEARVEEPHALQVYVRYLDQPPVWCEQVASHTLSTLAWSLMALHSALSPLGPESRHRAPLLREHLRNAINT